MREGRVISHTNVERVHLKKNVIITIARKENLINKTKHLFYSFISYMHIMTPETSLVKVYKL